MTPPDTSDAAYAVLTGSKSTETDHEQPALARFVPISSLVLGDRQRTKRSEEALNRLATSISEIGLLHAPVVSGDTLRAGAGRLLAMSILHTAGQPFTYCGTPVPPGTAPVIDLGALDPISAKVVELDENIQREDLSWQDRLQALADLDTLRKAQNAQHTTRDTGAEVFPDLHPAVAYTKVKEATVLVNHLNDPDIAKAKNEREASKILKRKQEAHVNAQLAEIVGARRATDQHALVRADCIPWLSAYDGERFACAVLDPPYGMGAAEFGDAAGRLQGITHTYTDDAEHFQEIIRAVVAPLYKACADEAHVYIWCDIDGFHFIREELRRAGFNPHRTPLINVKREGGRVPWPEHGPRRCYELVAYAIKGKKPTTGIYPDVFESTLETTNIGHGAQKPVEAYVNLLKRSTRPDDLVLDCFAGSGTMIEAAHVLKLRSVVVERDASYFGLCLKRLEALK